MSADLIFRSHYAADPAGRAALADLLREIFDLDLTPLSRLGDKEMGGWDPGCTPFSYFSDDGRCIANVTAFAMPLMLNGRRIKACGVQSVAVRKAWRGKGLFRDLMLRALAWCDARGPLTLLSSAAPELYTPFGLRGYAQHSVIGPPAAASRRAATARPLSLQRDEDIALLRRLLRGRAPVSETFGLLDQAAMVLLNAAAMQDRVQLFHLPEQDVAVAIEQPAEGGFRLHDVIGANIPGLAEILAALDLQPNEVQVCFPPDRLGWTGTPHPVRQRTLLMARGPFLDPATPFMLPPLAAF